MSLNNIQISKDFKLSEFQDHRTMLVKIDARVVTYLQTLRNTVNMPIIVTSGYRTKLSNRIAGGVRNSYHTKGMAVDFYCPGTKLNDLALFALECGFTFVKVYEKKGFIHADIRDLS